MKLPTLWVSKSKIDRSKIDHRRPKIDLEARRGHSCRPPASTMLSSLFSFKFIQAAYSSSVSWAHVKNCSSSYIKDVPKNRTYLNCASVTPVHDDIKAIHVSNCSGFYLRKECKTGVLRHHIWIFIVQVHWSNNTIKNKKLSCRRDRRVLRAIEYFAKSLKVTQSKSLLVFHCNYLCISYRFWDI